MFLLISLFFFFMDDKVTLWIEDYLEQKIGYLASKIFGFRNTIMPSKNDTVLHVLSEEVLKFAVLEVCICSFLADYKSIYDLEPSPEIKQCLQQANFTEPINIF